MIRKNLDIIIVSFMMTAIVMYDVTLDFIEEFFHLSFEVFHNLFEWVELGVEKVVDRVFEMLHLGDIVSFLFITERHGSQVVTFYILMTMLGYMALKLSRFVPNSYQGIKRFALMSWIRRKTQFQLYWHSRTQLHKLALLGTALSVLLLGLLFII